MNTEISIKKLRVVTDELEECRRQLDHSENELVAIADSLKRFEDEALSTVAKKLEQQSTELVHSSKIMKSLQSTLERILSIYRICEESVEDMLEGGALKRKIKRTPKQNSLKHLGKILDQMNLHFQI